MPAGMEPPEIAVTVTRKRVRNLNLRVRRDGTVALSVPWHVSRARAQAFLNERAGWICAALERQRERAGIAHGAGTAGGRGEQAGPTADEAGCDGLAGKGGPGIGPSLPGIGTGTRGGIALPDPDGAGTSRYALWGSWHATTDGSPISREGLDALYREEVARALPDAIARMEALVGAHASGWQLRAMRMRWGSCTPRTGRIRINVRLAAYPPECLDYVVAHELAHLLEPSHNARFHVIVARACANEREVRARMRQAPAQPEKNG